MSDADSGAGADELTPQERIAELERENQILQTRVDSLVDGLERLEAVVLGDDTSPQEYRKEPMADQLDDIRGDVETAIGFARAKQGTRGKKITVAKRVSRNKAVLAAASGRTPSGGLPADRVDDLAGPGTNLEHRTIFDAWDELVDEYDCFHVVEDRPKGLKAKRGAINRDLVHVVKESLNDTDEVEKLNNFLEGVEG